MNHQQADAFIGAYAEFRNVNVNLDATHYSEGFHINQEMWVYLDPQESTFLEAGIRSGVDPGNSCRCYAYEWFWAEGFSSDIEGTGEVRHFIQYRLPNEDVHKWFIYQAGSVAVSSPDCNLDPVLKLIATGCGEYWRVNVDGIDYGKPIESQPVAYEHQVGLEISKSETPNDSYSWSSSEQEYFNQMQYLLSDEAGNNAQAQYTFWPYHAQWIDNIPGISGHLGNYPSEWYDAKS